MTSKPDQFEQMTVTHVGCRVCNCEVPLDEAVVPEATDYVVYFCGAPCYSTWRLAAVSASMPLMGDDIDAEFRQDTQASS